MARPKKSGKKRAAGKRRNKKLLLAMSVAGGLIVAVTGVLLIYILKPAEVPDLPESEDVISKEVVIPYEETYSSPDPPPLESADTKTKVEDQVVVPEGEKPRVAIIIDDMGYQKKTGEGLLDLDLNLTFAFLPFGPYTEKLAHGANRLDRDVLLHFPMEAADAKWKPGPGAVSIDMSREEIHRIFSRNLAAVPYVVGINNHMGSRFTQNSEAMQDFMVAVRSSGLFFVDSRTSQYTVGAFTAREMAVKTAKRDVFLDNVRDRGKITIQLRKLLKTAERKGQAIAIGHPYPETLAALKGIRGEIRRRVKVVGVSELVN
ncbi:MAG: divergent polysaccharide deacetylase family protein [Thermodesulfobacteriota bacterium]